MQSAKHERRPPSVTSIRATAARHARAAVETLAAVASDTAAPAAERVRAAETLLAYASAAPKRAQQ